MPALAVELTGLRQNDRVLQRTAAISRPEEPRRDGIGPVHLDDAVVQQVHAVAQIVPEGRFLGQQQHRRGGRALPQPAVLVSIIGAVSAQYAQVVVVHAAQIGHSHRRVQFGVQPHRGPVALHIGVVGVAAAVDRVIKGIVQHRGAIGAVLRGLLCCLCQLQVGSGIFLIRVLQQDAAQRAAAVGEAHHAVFLVGINGALCHQPLLHQVVQLFQRRCLAVRRRHGGVVRTVGQGGNGGVCLLHLGRFRSGQALHRCGSICVRLCSPCGRHCRYQQHHGAHRAEQAAGHRLLFHHFPILQELHTSSVRPVPGTSAASSSAASGAAGTGGNPHFCHLHCRSSPALCQASAPDFAKLSHPVSCNGRAECV